MTYKLENDVLTFNMRTWINMDNMWILPPDYLADVMKTLKYNTVIFDLLDSVNPYYSGFLEIAKCIVKDLGLEKNIVQILISGDTLNLDWATVTTNTSTPLAPWVVNQIKQEPPDNLNFDKKFLSMTNRYSLYRLKMAKFLHDNHANQTYLSFRDKSVDAISHMSKIGLDFYSNEIVWAKNFLPITLDTSDRVGTNGVTYESLIASATQFKSKYLFEIVIETDYHTNSNFTEKTFKPIAMGKPFLLFARSQSLKALHNLGFKTFSPFINEYYDEISNTEDRFRAITTEINKLADTPSNEIIDFVNEYEKILIHNQHVLYNGLYQKRIS